MKLRLEPFIHRVHICAHYFMPCLQAHLYNKYRMHAPMDT